MFAGRKFDMKIEGYENFIRLAEQENGFMIRKRLRVYTLHNSKKAVTAD